MEKKMDKDIINDDIKSNYRYRTLYAKSESLKKIKNNNEYKTQLNYLNKNNYKKQYKYSKLFSYSKEKLFLKEMKSYKFNKKSINSDKINKFHQIYIHNKIKSFSESRDYIELNSNNKTTTISDATSNNFSKNIKNKYSLLKPTSFLHYNNISSKTRNKAQFNNNKYIKTENDYNNVYKSTSINGFSMFKSIFNKDNNTSIVNNSFNCKDKKKTFLTINPPVKVLNYKFNDIIGNLNNNIYCEGKLTSSRGLRNGLTEQILAKLKFNFINKIKKDYYQTQFEIQQNPLTLFKEYERFQEVNKKYYNIYQSLIKKYFGYLYAQIDEEKYKLLLLNEEREKIKEENFQILKKINILNEKLVFYQSFMKLLLKIKYNTISLDILPEEVLRKYGITLPRSKNGDNNVYKKYFKRYSYFMITETQEKYKPKFKRKSTINFNNKKIFNRTKSNNYNEIYKMNKEFKKLKSKDNNQKKMNLFLARKKSAEYEIIPKIPVFNDVEELFERLKGIETHLKDLYKESADKRYIIQILKTELYKEKSKVKIDKNLNLKYNIKDFDILKEELVKAKEQNLIYINFRKYLNIIKNKNYIEYKPKINESNTTNKIDKKEKETKGKDEKNKIKKNVNISDKLISILLKLNINIEDFIDYQGIYNFLKSPQEIKINSQGKEYMKTIFCLKILEIIFLKLMEKRREYLSNNKTRKKYLELEEITEKNDKIMKIIEKRKEEVNQRIRREKEILIKSSRIPILPIKKDDPYSYNIYYEKYKKSEKERLKNIRKNEEIDIIFNNFISY